ncbi:LANO_0H15258g1_1 [Lachancea nothofagi CBS 11611]|uniref:LANO_0H15258g1_1 n=1 Tax=Lachancea nothofagi CBS 11611 TaxID=1266666 RepID=A0A1G4KMM2_9SACH|nr:LANO_0H15258g1_1 [Lachancea nothofagi CBS 11611]
MQLWYKNCFSWEHSLLSQRTQSNDNENTMKFELAKVKTQVRSTEDCLICQKYAIRCNRNKPRCERCESSRLKCSYPLLLKWGGRQYRDKKKVPKIPPNTKMVNGVLVIKDKSVLKGWSVSKVGNGYTLVNEPNFLSCEDMALRRPASAKEHEYHTSGVSEEAPGNPSPALALHGKSARERTVHRNSSSSGSNRLQFSVSALGLMISSWRFSESFDFYVKDTSSLFVVYSKRRDSNPFHYLLPQMALQSPTLMKAIIAFGGRHKQHLLSRQEGNDYASLEECIIKRTDFEVTAREFLSTTVMELANDLKLARGLVSDLILATVLVLSNFSFFFGDQENMWRTHLYGAEQIILKSINPEVINESICLQFSVDEGPRPFLERWFFYMKVMATLSSGDFGLAINENLLKLDFSAVKKKKTMGESMKNIEKAEYLNGMEVSVFAYLADVASLIIEKRLGDNNGGSTIFLRAVELDYRIMDFLKNSFELRSKEQIGGQHSATSLHKVPRYTSEHSLHSTNLLFGLSAVLQLRRRILGFSNTNDLIKNLLYRILSLLETDFSHEQSIRPGMLFSIFSFGCELIDDEFVSKRSFCSNHLSYLASRGVSCADQALSIMRECWEKKKSWWQVLKDKNLDVCFAI